MSADYPGRERRLDYKIDDVYNAVFGDPRLPSAPGLIETVRRLDGKVSIAIAIAIAALGLNNPVTAHFFKVWFGW